MQFLVAQAAMKGYMCNSFLGDISNFVKIYVENWSVLTAGLREVHHCTSCEEFSVKKIYDVCICLFC